MPKPATAPATTALEGLPGVGPKLAERLIATFGSAEACLETARAAHIDQIAKVPGVGEARAIEIVHAVRGTGHIAFFGTGRAARVFDSVRDRLLERCATEAGRNQIRLIAPLADPQERQSMLQDVTQARSEIQALDLDAARDALRHLGPLGATRSAYEATVAIFVDTKADREALVDAGVDRWAPIVSARDHERARSVEAAIYAYTDGSSGLMDAPHAVAIPFSTDPAIIVPWSETTRFERSRESLVAAAQLSRLRGLSDDDAPSAAVEALAVIDGLRATNTEFDPNALAPLVQETYEEALEAAEQGLSELTVSGKDLVAALSSRAPPAVREVYAGAMAEAAERIKAACGLDFEPFTETVPPEIDDAAVAEARRGLMGRGAIRRLEAQAAAAERLVALRGRVDDEIADHLAFDARQALGSFARDHALTAPVWGDGLVLDGALHLDHPDGDRVDYRLGAAGGGDDDASVGASRLAMLTGANSGGKTTLLETIAQVMSMAHAGLPVPALTATVPEVEALHFFAQKRSLSAGAFEDFLVRFFPVAQAEGRVFVLADEVEAMTELEAAAEIIASFLEALAARDAFAVFVSHMGPHVLPLLGDLVRVDGIEATGLDHDDRLVVSRTPQLGVLARSTPELILTRLSRTAPDEMRPLFAGLAERVRKRMGSLRSED